MTTGDAVPAEGASAKALWLGCSELGRGWAGDTRMGDKDLWVHVKGTFITGEHKLTCVDLFSGKWVRGKEGWSKGPAGQ